MTISNHPTKIISYIIIIVSLYFIFLIIYGKYGIFKYQEINKKLNKLDNQLSLIIQKKAKLKQWKKDLSDESLSLERLEEEVRKKLNRCHNNEKFFKPIITK